MSDFDISGKYMEPSKDVAREGLVISESANIMKNILALLLSLSAKDEEEEDESAEVEYDIEDDSILQKVDAYQSAQILTNIIKKSKDVFVQRAIEHALKTKGVFEQDDVIMAQEAFIAGILTLALFRAMTSMNLAPDEVVTKTSADYAKAFLIGAGTSWIGTKGRYQIKKLEKEEEKAQNEMAANPMGNMGDPSAQGPGGPGQQFAEGSTPGKKNINAQSADKTQQNVKEANSLKQVSPKIDKDETQSGDIAAGEEIDQERRELLSHRDYFAYVNNYMLVESDVKNLVVVLVKNLRNTNFQGYLDYMTENVWEDQYGIKSLLHKYGGKNKKKKDKKSITMELDILQSIAYDFISLLTLISKDMTEKYITKRYKLQKAINEEEESLNDAYGQEIAAQDPYGAEQGQQPKV